MLILVDSDDNSDRGVIEDLDGNHGDTLKQNVEQYMVGQFGHL